MSRILVYSGLTWHSFSESHCHNLTRVLAKNHLVHYLEVPYCKDKSRHHINDNCSVNIPDNVTIIGAKKALPFGLSYFLKSQIHSIKSFFKYHKRFDVAFLYNIYDLPFLFLCKLFGKKVVYSIVDDYPELTPNSFVKGLLTFYEQFFLILKDASFVTAKALLQKDKESVYIPNTIRLEKQKNELPKFTNFSVAHVGTLGKWINTNEINQAAKNLPHVNFYIVGDGERFSELANLPNLIKYGQISKERVGQILQQVHVGLICFKINKITNSVSPIKLFEYFNAKLPVITSRTKELLTHNERIFYYDKNNNLTEMIKLLMNNWSVIDDKVQKGYDYVQQNNWNTIGKQYEKIIKSVIQK